MNLLIVSPAVVVSEFGASVSPSSYNQRVGNGSFTTLKFKATAENETGSLSYQWSYEILNSQASTVNINSPTEPQTTLTVSSYNSNIRILLSCDVTDDNETIKATSILNIQFGTGGIEP